MIHGTQDVRPESGTQDPYDKWDPTPRHSSLLKPGTKKNYDPNDSWSNILEIEPEYQILVIFNHIVKQH